MILSALCFDEISDTPPLETPNISFTSPTSFTLSAPKNWNGSIEYSYDKSSWSTWEGEALTGTEIYLRGTGNTVITGSGTSNKWTISGSNVSGDGNLEALLDYATVMAGGHPAKASYVFQNMFFQCTALITGPYFLGGETPSDGFHSTFFGCTNLQSVAELGYAAVNASYAYYETFSGCTSLVHAPKMNIVDATMQAYSYMFQGCTHLVEMPVIKGTSFLIRSLTCMFNGCSSLKISTTPTAECPNAFRIPDTGTATFQTRALDRMFDGTGGTFVGTPSGNTTYYTNATIIH